MTYIAWQNFARPHDGNYAEIFDHAETIDRSEWDEAGNDSGQSTRIIAWSANNELTTLLHRLTAVHPLVIGSLQLLISLAALVATSPVAGPDP